MASPLSTTPNSSWQLATTVRDGRACGPPLCGGTPPATPPWCSPSAACGVDATLYRLRPNAPPPNQRTPRPP